MPLPQSYLSILDRLAAAFGAYFDRTGVRAVLVGGAAVAIYTAGEFPSADFDVVAGNDVQFDAAMADQGFRREDRVGVLRIGYYHPAHPAYGVQQVSGALFDGLADRDRLYILRGDNGGEIALPAIEDMIADRLCQYAVASPTDTSRLEQARALFRLSETLDREYLLRRIRDEGGDPALLGGLL